MPPKKLVFSTHLQYVLIGLWAAVAGNIPVIGVFPGTVPAVLIPLFAALFPIARQRKGNVPVPRLTGGPAGVHPLRIRFATIAATARYGLVGAGGTATLPERLACGTGLAGEVPAGMDGGMPSPGMGG